MALNTDYLAAVNYLMIVFFERCSSEPRYKLKKPVSSLSKFKLSIFSLPASVKLINVASMNSCDEISVMPCVTY